MKTKKSKPKPFLAKLARFFPGLILGLIFGIFLTISIVAVNAALDPPVSSGDNLTASLWNNMRSEIQANTAAISSLPRVSCSWTGERYTWGNGGGCFDDLYVTCTGGFVVSMRMGC